MRARLRPYGRQLRLLLRAGDVEAVAFVLALVALVYACGFLLPAPTAAAGDTYAISGRVSPLLWAACFGLAGGGLLHGALDARPGRFPLAGGSILFVATLAARTVALAIPLGAAPGLLVYGALILVAFWVLWRDHHGD